MSDCILLPVVTYPILDGGRIARGKMGVLYQKIQREHFCTTDLSDELIGASILNPLPGEKITTIYPSFALKEICAQDES